MATRIQNMPKKDFDRNPVVQVSHFSGNYPSWWGVNEQQVPQAFPKNVGSKDDSPRLIHHEAKNLGLTLADQDSSSTQSMGLSQHEPSVVGGVDSQDHSISSESGPDESSCKSVDGQMKPLFLFGNPEVVFNPPQADHSHPWARVPYPPVDPYYGGLLAAYGPQAIPQMGSQMVGMAPTRVPLPLNLSEDGPIYVNAKQYHGILRRRQSRAKLEAQNKLVKARKPYLHESRHLHALNRVRGSGGRFLSTKKLQQSDLSSTSCPSKVPEIASKLKDASLLESHHSGTTLQFTSTIPTCSEATSMSNCDVYYLPTNSRFSGITSRVGGAMQHGGGLMCGAAAAAQHCSPSVR